MNYLWITTCLLVGLFASALATEESRWEKRQQDTCLPREKDKVMVLPGPIKDFAMKENAILYDLRAVTICMIATWNPFNIKPKDNQCVFSYAIPGSDNELTLCTYPTTRVLIHGNRRDAGDKGLPSDGLYHHVCFTWSNQNGDFQFWKDGKVVGEGSDLYKGGLIKHGGTLVIGQDQDEVGGKFDPDQSWIGEVSGLNVWGTVLSESDITAQYRNCYVTAGSTIMWSQLYAKESLHGDVFVYP